MEDAEECLRQETADHEAALAPDSKQWLKDSPRNAGARNMNANTSVNVCMNTDMSMNANASTNMRKEHEKGLKSTRRKLTDKQRI